MNALQVMDRYWKEVIQVNTRKNDKKVQYDTNSKQAFKLPEKQKTLHLLFRLMCHNSDHSCICLVMKY